MIFSLGGAEKERIEIDVLRYERAPVGEEFQTLEKQLHLKIKGDGKGRVALNGELLDQAEIGNRLNFSFQFDQVALGESIREIKAVTGKFPVRST